jgi:hypothetical protein
VITITGRLKNLNFKIRIRRLTSIKYLKKSILVLVKKPAFLAFNLSRYGRKLEL